VKQKPNGYGDFISWEKPSKHPKKLEKPSDYGRRKRLNYL